MHSKVLTIYSQSCFMWNIFLESVTVILIIFLSNDHIKMFLLCLSCPCYYHVQNRMTWQVEQGHELKYNWSFCSPSLQFSYVDCYINNIVFLQSTHVEPVIFLSFHECCSSCYIFFFMQLELPEKLFVSDVIWWLYGPAQTCITCKCVIL